MSLIHIILKYSITTLLCSLRFALSCKMISTQCQSKLENVLSKLMCAENLAQTHTYASFYVLTYICMLGKVIMHSISISIFFNASYTHTFIGYIVRNRQCKAVDAFIGMCWDAYAYTFGRVHI